MVGPSGIAGGKADLGVDDGLYHELYVPCETVWSSGYGQVLSPKPKNEISIVFGESS